MPHPLRKSTDDAGFEPSPHIIKPARLWYRRATGSERLKYIRSPHAALELRFKRLALLDDFRIVRRPVQGRRHESDGFLNEGHLASGQSAAVFFQPLLGVCPH